MNKLYKDSIKNAFSFGCELFLMFGTYNAIFSVGYMITTSIITAVAFLKDSKNKENGQFEVACSGIAAIFSTILAGLVAWYKFMPLLIKLPLCVCEIGALSFFVFVHLKGMTWNEGIDCYISGKGRR